MKDVCLVGFFPCRVKENWGPLKINIYGKLFVFEY